LKRALEVGIVLAALAAISVGAVAYVHARGWTLYYGDAEAHLNSARRIIDSRTPGYDQVGTSWLPLPHLLALAFAGGDHLWRSGLAGAIPSAGCFITAGLFLFAATRRATQSLPAASVALGLFALNPNLLYLQSTPMTESVLMAGVMAVLYFTILFHQTQSILALVAAGAASMLTSLARYEGWFLIPFVTIYVFSVARRWHLRLLAAVLFGAIASLGPLYWLAHNWWLYGNPLEFYNGPYSAKAIYQRSGTYPGDHDWRKAWLFFRTAAVLCSGWGVVIIAAVGLAGCLIRRTVWPVMLLLLPSAFYLWSMYSGTAAIFVPQLWYGSYYNTRYGLAALPLFAAAGAGFVLLFRGRSRAFAALAAILVGVAPWIAAPEPDRWICWKESQVNSTARRAWTTEAARFMADHYHRGEGIFTSFGDLPGILREAGIPLRESLHDCNEPWWMAATARPDLFLHEEWAIAISGDPVATAIQRASFKNGPHYRLIKCIMLKDAPVIEIYKRD